MTEFRHCPICGGYLSEKRLPTEQRSRLVCETCEHIFYINPRVVCGTLLIQDGKVWLLRRGIEPRLGYWTHPAGYQEIDESSEEAAVRETFEELGCLIEITGLHGVYSRPHAPVVNIVFLARLNETSQPPGVTEEATEVRLFDRDALPWRDLAFISTAAALHDWISAEKSDS